MDSRTKEAIRYLGYGQKEVDDKTLFLMQECFAQLDELAKPILVSKMESLQIDSDRNIFLGNLEIKSHSLYRNLKDCIQVILLAATLGVGVDRQIRKYEVTDLAKAVVMQACAAAYLEEYCDNVQTDLEQQYQEEGLYLRPRFSPGYGDFSITHQKDVLAMLEAPKKIGLTLTEGCMLTPTKSVTALIGISKIHTVCHQKGCEECKKTDCEYRRS